MESIFEQYKKLNYVPSLEEEREMITRYVYFTNQLEGNKLSLAQTTSILEKGVVSGDNISLRDILEHKGMEKAVFRMLKAAYSDEPLSEALLLELNWLCIGSFYKSDEAYIKAKEKGQVPGQYKKVENRIRITLPNGNTQIIIPESSPQNVQTNMNLLIKRINLSPSDTIEKAVFLAQEIWLHQPFIDGNKRTGRLLINFLTIKAGYPLFVYEDKDDNYNHLLIKQYNHNQPGLLLNYVTIKLNEEMTNILKIYQDAENNKSKGYRMTIK